jgi:cytochrome c biogenesis protein CcdA
VALMLIGLGILNLTGGLRSFTERVTPPAPMHAHDHAHASGSHGHLHGHGEHPGLVATFGRYQLIRPVVVGLVHGLAGSAAVALLVLATIQDTGTAIAYLVIFCIGVAAGMAVLTTVIGLPFMVSKTRSAQINRWLTIGSGILSLAFGLLLAYEIGFEGGLFTGDFNWEPA